MPTLDELHAFLRQNYRRDRFEGRNGPEWGNDYSRRVAASHMEDLERRGYGLIDAYNSSTGRVVKYTPDLRVEAWDA